MNTKTFTPDRIDRINTASRMRELHEVPNGGWARNSLEIDFQLCG